MKPLSRDTTVEAQRKHYELMRRLTPSQRLAMAFELTEAGRKLILADLKHRFPQAKEEEIRRRFIARVLPRADVIRVYGFDPRAEGF
jgi:metallophosphoesterase superfamily enzyme